MEPASVAADQDQKEPELMVARSSGAPFIRKRFWSLQKAAAELCAEIRLPTPISKRAPGFVSDKKNMLEGYRDSGTVCIRQAQCDGRLLVEGKS